MSAVQTAVTPSVGPEPGEFRALMGRYATGVAVVTSQLDGEPHGMTVSSLTSVSLAPPLLLVCLTRGTRTADAVVGSGRFAANLLNDRQASVSDCFARPGEDHFAAVDVERDSTGLPLLRDALGHVVCRNEAVHGGGDHVVVIGAVEALRHGTGHPLVFLGGCYKELAPGGRDAALGWYW